MFANAQRIQTIAIFAVLALLLVVSPAHATQFQYFVRGNVSAPIDVSLNGNTINPGNATFNLDFDNAGVILTYDDAGTAGLADDTMSIQGVVGGSITYDPYGPNAQDRLSNYLFAVGAYDFEIDLLVSNPIASLTPDPGTRFAFGEQAAGTMTLLNSPFGASVGNPPYWSQTSTLMIKNDKNFAFNVFPDLTDPSRLVGEGWLVVMDGFLGIGNGSRWEFGDKNSQLNWDFRLEAVPEPVTAGLLSLGLLGGALTRRRANKNS